MWCQPLFLILVHTLLSSSSPPSPSPSDSASVPLATEGGEDGGEDGGQEAWRKARELMDWRQYGPPLLEHIQVAAGQGHKEGLNLLGMLFLKGNLGLTQDYDRALELFKQAADLGHSISSANAGYMYDQGLGVEQSNTMAIEWFSRSVDEGNLNMASYLADLCKKEGRDECVVNTLSTGAESGDVKCLHGYGRILELGSNGVDQNIEKATELYKQAAEAGYPAAQLHLANLLITRTEGSEEEDPMARNDNAGTLDQSEGAEVESQEIREKQASHWAEKAAYSNKSPAAMEYFGLLLNRGIGRPQDHSAAVDWHRRAASNGDSTAMTNLGILFREGLGVDADIGEAFRWLRRASETGNGFAKLELSAMEEDVEVRRTLLQEAVDGDTPGAQAMLAALENDQPVSPERTADKDEL